MTENLWSNNRPQEFWKCSPLISSTKWEQAIQRSLPILNINQIISSTDDLMELTLGERQFGPTHWVLSPARRIYYLIKPLLPRPLTRLVRQSLNKYHRRDFGLGWPVEPRYPRFQFEVLKNLLEISGLQALEIQAIWPEYFIFAFVLTHDIETETGQKFVKVVADMEESLGFRSSFNFVPEKYDLDYKLMDDLRKRGFEVGIHGLKHNGRLFTSRSSFTKKATLINRHLKEIGATGFRAELTLRQPRWMQELEIEYDLSFFDTDPFEPIPGGTMSIWPFFLGHFVELPYTLAQDYTLTSVLGENSPRIWVEKVDFIEKYHGMALVNTHPDYLKRTSTWNIYRDFLQLMKKRIGYWHALPGEVARWWKSRSVSPMENDLTGTNLSTVHLQGESIQIDG